MKLYSNEKVSNYQEAQRVTTQPNTEELPVQMIHWALVDHQDHLHKRPIAHYFDTDEDLKLPLARLKF